MIIDVAICTFNRPKKLLNLVHDLQSCHPAPNKIIVVDSSEERNDEMCKEKLVEYFQANHKNQPYQRYIAYRKSTAAILVYLDDDMEVIEKNFMERIQQRFLSNDDVIAMPLCFKDKQANTSLANIPSTQLTPSSDKVKKFIRWITAYPTMPEGKFGLCGIRGRQPDHGGYTQLLSGGAFAVKRKFLYQNFNFQLFDLFEEKIGMGEDGILGYNLSKLGKLYYEPQLLFYHNDEHGSHYAANQKAYAERVLFSRLFLSLEKTRLDGGNKLLAHVHYVYYSVWRLLGYSINYLKSRRISRKEILLGSWRGFKKTWSFKLKPLETTQAYWLKEYEANKN
jgi:glycosyltransferase involved in cell wall biosynthesis